MHCDTEKVSPERSQKGLDPPRVLPTRVTRCSVTRQKAAARHSERQATPVPVDSPWLTTREAADYSRFNVSHINRSLRAGDLLGYQATRTGKWKIHRDDLDAWIRRNSSTDTPPAVTPLRTASR
jgi:excisionase family DNA binding protein